MILAANQAGKQGHPITSFRVFLHQGVLQALPPSTSESDGLKTGAREVGLGRVQLQGRESQGSQQKRGGEGVGRGEGRGGKISRGLWGLIAGFQPLELQSKRFLWFKHPCLCRLCYVSPSKLTYAFQARPHWLPAVFL